MIEKRCKIEFKKANYISVKCSKCGSETNMPLQGRAMAQRCGVCEEFFGVPLVKYIENLKKLEFLSEEFDVSLVRVEAEE